MKNSAHKAETKAEKARQRRLKEESDDWKNTVIARQTKAV